MATSTQHQITAEAALAEYLLAQAKRELKRYPRSPVITTPTAARDIDMSGVFLMTEEEVYAALREMEAA